MELILVEMLRREPPKVDERATGLIAGLLDAAISGALPARHAEIAREWTVAALARLCGVSRSGLATRFKDVLGVGPIEYFTRWRMAVAKDELRRGRRSISEIALAVGFQSASAFSTSFTRAVGCSPKRFAERAA
jgi:AraC-like DNA-binding protein